MIIANKMIIKEVNLAHGWDDADRKRIFNCPRKRSARRGSPGLLAAFTACEPVVFALILASLVNKNCCSGLEESIKGRWSLCLTLVEAVIATEEEEAAAVAWGGASELWLTLPETFNNDGGVNGRRLAFGLDGNDWTVLKLVELTLLEWPKIAGGEHVCNVDVSVFPLLEHEFNGSTLVPLEGACGQRHTCSHVKCCRQLDRPFERFATLWDGRVSLASR